MYDLISAKSVFRNYANSDFRPYQAEAIQFALDSEKKIVVLEASTGSGKSLIGLTIGSAFGSLTYLVHTKILQNQITQDFPEAKSLFGRSNYSCIQNPSISCEDCLHSILTPCPHKRHGCIYENAKKDTLNAKFRILNYDYYLSECNYVGKFSNSPLIVIDEADSLENTLINFTTLTFTPFALRRMNMLDQADRLKMTSKDRSGLLDSWKDFGFQAKDQVKIIIDRLSDQIDRHKSKPEEQASLIQEKMKVSRLNARIDLFLSNVSSDWILDNQDSGRLIFRPLWMTQELAQEYLWRHGQKFILMSASFYPRPILAKCLGIDLDDIDYTIVPSQFPISNRPVYIYPAANMTAKTTDTELPKLIDSIKSIIDSYPDVKGIIHCVSYSLANKIINSISNDRLITHNSTDRQEVIDKFISSDKPLILCSPSLERGVSLDEDKCRFIIIVKAPFLSLGDKITSLRLYSSGIGQAWYTSTMLLTILQMAGRGVRSKEDKADTYILDLKAKEAITKYPSYLPDWFLDAMQFNLPSTTMTSKQ